MGSTAVTGTGPSAGTAPGARPRPLRAVDHDSDHGFCSVCGAVWPCSRARREQAAASAPTW